MDNIGGGVKTLVAFTPRALSGEVAHNGDAIDRTGFESAVFTCVAGKYTSTPTSINVACKVQDCATATGSFADVTDPVDPTNLTYGTVRISGEFATVADQDQEINLDLRACSKFVRLVVTPDFTSGSSPTLFFGATVTLGEPRISPA